ncbi:hypothetical protein DSM104299_01063 [Baekduia alba]|nr:hypothetical protein DSM104299_01063 [Baekduia alba]
MALLCGGLALATGAHAATVIANGNDPDSIVDRDGITHVVWNESRPGNDDVLHYCQIPRGATACSNAITRTPAGGGSDVEGPHVMVTPFGEVLLMTNRNFENLVYVSDDGGATFPATPVSIGTVGAAYTGSGSRAIFDGADRRVLTIEGPTQGIRLQAAPLAAEGNPQTRTTAYASLTSYSAYDPSVVQRERNSFVAAWADLGDTTFVRTYTCTLNPCPLSDVNNAAKWTPQVAIPDAELPELTTGPSGTFVMYRSTAGATDNQYFIRKIDGTTVGPALAVSDGNGGNFRDIVQDAGGILHALFIDKDTGLGYRASGDGGVTWGDQQTLVPGPDFTLGHIRVTARTVDEGFTGSAMWESQNGGEQNPRIFLEGLPDPSVSLHVTLPSIPGLPAPPATPGQAAPPPPATCRLLTFAAVDVIADACLKKEGNAYVATGGVKINGLRIELGGGKLKLDPKARTITSSGATVTVKVGDTVLYKDDINWTLPKASIASLGSIDVSGGGDLIGFPLKGKAELKFRGGGAEIPVHLGLPALFGGVTGDVTIRADNVAGVHLRELHVKVGDALIGPLEIKDLFFDYDADAVSWAGGAKVILPPQPPGPSIESKIGFTHGDLDYLSAELTLPPGVFLDPFAVTQLKKIRFSLKTQPSLQLKGGITVDAGPEIAGVSAIRVDGDLTFTLSDPIILRADGTISLVSIPLATAFFELRTNGYVGFGGHLGYAFSGFSATADVSGFLFKSAFNVEAGADICLGDFGCVGGQVVFSSTGFAGCAQTPIADFGAGYKWGEGLDIMWSGCDIAPFRATAAAAQAGGARSVTFGQGLPSGVVAVEGQGAPPHVSLVGPGGARIDAPATGKLQTADAIAFHVPETNTTYFVVKAPAAGAWTIEPAADSVPVTGVKAADGLDDPKVTTHLTRAADGRRELKYTINSVPGQKVTFAEQGKGAAQAIGTAKGLQGTLRFTPADGPGGTRKIIAMVSSNGRPRTTLTVGSYVAPPPAKPATPKRLKATRTSKALKISWATAKNAKRYEIRATLSDGRRLLSRQKPTRLTIGSVTSTTRATITVTGLKADGTRGKKATIKVAAKKATKKPKTKKK